MARDLARGLEGALSYLGIGLIRAYQLVLSPLLGPTCRFHPSCSCYARQALELHGFWAGLALAARRIGRCHPWNRGGVDPVPLPPDRSAGRPS